MDTLRGQEDALQQGVLQQNFQETQLHGGRSRYLGQDDNKTKQKGIGIGQVFSQHSKVHSLGAY